MIRRSFPLSLVLLSISSPAFATEARNNVLANPAGLDDEVHVFSFPSLVNRYSLALAELGNVGNGESYVAAFTQTSAGSFGVALRRDQSVFNYFDANTLNANDPDLVAKTIGHYRLNTKFAARETGGVSPRRPIDLFYGLPLGEDKGFGVRLTLAGDTNEVNLETTGKTKKDAQQADLTFGYHMPVSTGRLDLALRVGLVGKIEVANEPPNGAPKTAAVYNRNLAVRASGRYVEIKNANLKPYVKGSLDYQAPDVQNTAANKTETKKGKDLVFDVQAGGLFAPKENVQLNGGGALFYFDSEGPYSLSAPTAPAGLSVDQAIQRGVEKTTATTVDGKTKRSGYGVLANLGAEALVSESFGVMTGLHYTLWGRLTTKDDFTAGKPKYTTNLAETSDNELFGFGVFYKREALRIDAAAEVRNFLHNGPNFITGATTAPILGQISGSYRF